MTDKMENLINWIYEELNNRGWSQKYAAELGGITRSALNGFVNRKQKNPGEKMIRALSQAFGKSEDVIKLMAGIIPEYQGIDPTTAQVIYLMKQMSDDEREDELAELEAKVERRKKRGNGRLSE